MIGLPVKGTEDEAAAFVRYVTELRRSVPMEYIVNVGTFVPKPHTPFQWDRQMGPEEGERIIDEIRSGLPRGTKLRAHDPWNSWLEGLMTRGDADISRMIEEAYENGARLDAWDEHADIALWRRLAETDRYREAVKRALGPRGFDEALPWDAVSTGVSGFFLKQERKRADAGELTEPCRPNCEVPCGVCNRYVTVRDHGEVHGGPGKDERDREPEGGHDGESNRERKTRDGRLNDETERVERTDRGSEAQTVPGGPVDPHDQTRTDTGESTTGRDNRPAPTGAELDPNHGREYQLVLAYTKRGSAAFLPHLALVRTFERAWHRIGLPFALTQGYHPKPKMSFGQPLPLGAASEDEIVIVNVQNIIQLDNYYRTIDSALPDGFGVTGMLLLHHEKGSPRIPSPMQRYTGSRYRLRRKLETNRPGDAPVWNVIVEALAAFGVAGEVQDEEITFFLPDDAPGIGRIKKEIPRSDLLTIERLGMYADREGDLRLYEYYRNLPNRIALAESAS
jgi:radical SAM-linked protein